MKRIYFFLAIISFALNSGAQHICKGIIKDSISGTGVEFANIGIPGKGFGTVTDEFGNYKFEIPDSLLNQKVRISMIGYKTKELPVKQALSLETIILSQDAVKLDEVAVKAKKLKITTLGNRATGQGIVAGFKKNNLGAELAVKLNIKHPKTQLRDFKVNIALNKLEKALFRLNIYSADKNGDPGENILRQSIIIDPKEKTGLIELDLKPYSIYVDDDVFVSLEWIKDLGDATGLMFSSKLIGTGTYFRQASQDKWQKVSAVGVGIHVEVGY